MTSERPRFPDLARFGRGAAFVLPALLTACVGVQTRPSGITDNPWRAQISALQDGKRQDGQAGAGQSAAALSAAASGEGRVRYYLDCGGNDNNDGRSPERAWRSLSKAASASLQAGQALLLKRGCSWDGSLEARWVGTADAPVVIGAYGEGALPKLRGTAAGPVVRISGQHQVLEFLDVSAVTPAPQGYGRCPNQVTAWRTGFSFGQGAQGNVVQYARASGLTAGVHFEGGTNNKALHNMLVRNTLMSKNTPGVYDDDSGAWGVLLNASGNEVAYNYFEGNTACSEDYGVEGASVELFKASDNYVHHNVSVNDSTFAELGGQSGQESARNTFAYNLYAPVDTGGEMLVLRGSKSKWGANPGTKFYNNTGYLVTLGISCSDGCDRSILSARNNILWARTDSERDLVFADAAFDEGNNLLWRQGGVPRVSIGGGALDPTSKIANPLFANPSALDFRLAPGSPARGVGTVDPIRALGISADLDGTPVNGAPDLGALQSKR